MGGATINYDQNLQKSTTATVEQLDARLLHLEEGLKCVLRSKASGS